MFLRSARSFSPRLAPAQDPARAEAPRSSPRLRRNKPCSGAHRPPPPTGVDARQPCNTPGRPKHACRPTDPRRSIPSPMATQEFTSAARPRTERRPLLRTSNSSPSRRNRRGHPRNALLRRQRRKVDRHWRKRGSACAGIPPKKEAHGQKGRQGLHAQQGGRRRAPPSRCMRCWPPPREGPKTPGTRAPAWSWPTVAPRLACGAASSCWSSPPRPKSCRRLTSLTKFTPGPFIFKDIKSKSIEMVFLH